VAEPEAGSKPPEGKGGISKKVGPLPIWAWAVILAAAGFIWWKYFGPGKAAATPAAAAPKTSVIEVRGERGRPGQPGQRGPRGKKGGKGSGPAKVDVPDVRGEPYVKAGKEIKSRGLIAQRSAPFVGHVRSESPYPGAKVDKGTVVTLRGRPWKFLPSPGGGQPQDAPAMATAGQVVTPQSDMFQAWNDDGMSDSAPAPAFAPMTAGSIHG
jgi:hypothetical protein